MKMADKNVPMLALAGLSRVPKKNILCVKGMLGKMTSYIVISFGRNLWKLINITATLENWIAGGKEKNLPINDTENTSS